LGDDLIFSEIKDWKRYRTLEDLRSVVGVSDIVDIPRLVVKELVDNALDACEICRIERPDEHGIFVEDEGDGIPGNDEDIARMFSVRRALVSSKYVRKPTRGALGNGLRFVTGAVLSTGGYLRVSTRGRTLDLRPEFTTGDTTILASQAYARHGTRIELSLPELRLTGALEWG
jgi:DNA topoisomerase VI subunit B